LICLILFTYLVAEPSLQASILQKIPPQILVADKAPKTIAGVSTILAE
jgi:hypothetical protein